MTETDIIQNQTAISECAQSFRQDANGIMNELARDFNFSLEATDIFPKGIYNHKYNNKGIFREEWTYFFNGSACRFDNLQTGQIIELIYITKPEFGFLDGYFLYNYMATTTRFNELANWSGNHLNVWTAIDILADRGVLTRTPSVSINRNVIAL